MEVIFIRHLPTPGNEKKQYIGRTDEALSHRAVTSFRKKREMYLKNLKETDGESISFYPPAEMIVASPMKRCVQTAELIYPGQKIVTEPELRECDFGRFEGKTYEELKGDPAYIAWLESGGTLAFPEGEDQETFRNRCAKGSADGCIRALQKRKKVSPLWFTAERLWPPCTDWRKGSMAFMTGRPGMAGLSRSGSGGRVAGGQRDPP